MKSCATLLLVTFISACAGTPPAAPPGASTSATAVEGSTRTTVAATITTGEDGRSTRFAGYRRVERGGQVLYCKRDAPTGSRLRAAEVCLTEADLLKVESDSQEYLRDLQRSPEGEQKINAGPGG